MTNAIPLAGFVPARTVRAVAVRVPWLALATAALVAGTGFAGGGYFPSSWGWPLLAAGWAAVLALLLADRGLSAFGAAAAVLLVALAGWTAASAAWSLDPTASVLEAERTAVYAAVVLAALLWAGGRPGRLLAGVWAGGALLCGWALVTRLVPDRFGVVDPISGYRLSEPIGYWNGLGLLAAIGALLALGLAARGPGTWARCAGAASVPVFVTTLYFTFSRGAWVALAGGLIAALVLGRRRLQLLATALAVAPGAALVVWRAAVSTAMTTWGSPLPEMARQGHDLSLVLADGALASTVAVLVVVVLEPKVRLRAAHARAAWLGVGLALAVAAAVLFVRAGSPVTLAQRGWHGFSGTPPAASGSLNGRLFHLSGNGRLDQWRVAWREARARPALGSGAGTFEIVWLRDRPSALKVRDAHNLYLETVAELGAPGLLLLVGALALPLVAAVRQRELFAAFGAYVAFLIHAAVDWDWELPAVTIAALLCGAAIMAAPRVRLRLPARSLAIAGAAALAGLGIYTVACQLPVSRIGTAASHADWPAAEADARRASALAPWSSQPWFALGEVELAAGRLPDARAALRRATAKSPRDWTAWFDLARASTGPARAHALARASALNPLSPEIAAFRRRDG